MPAVRYLARSRLLASDYHAWLATPSVAGTSPAADFHVEAPATQTRNLLVGEWLLRKRQGML